MENKIKNFNEFVNEYAYDRSSDIVLVSIDEFFNVLKPGDKLKILCKWGTMHYTVTRKSAGRIYVDGLFTNDNSYLPVRGLTLESGPDKWEVVSLNDADVFVDSSKYSPSVVDDKVDESLGFNIKTRDKRIIDNFFNKQEIPKISKYSDIYVRVKDNEHIFYGAGGGLAWVDFKNKTVKLGYPYGNISQTYLNYVRKVCKREGFKIIEEGKVE